jgi:DNA-binding phage protein
MHRLIDYQENLIKILKDPQEALAYLNAALQDDDPRIFAFALNNVLEAQLNKKRLQTIHPIKANFALTSIKAALNLLNLEFIIQEREPI